MTPGDGYTKGKYRYRVTGGLGNSMMDWLVGNIQIFGLEVENWILLIGGGLALYFAVLAIAGRRRQGVR